MLKFGRLLLLGLCVHPFALSKSAVGDTKMLYPTGIPITVLPSASVDTPSSWLQAPSQSGIIPTGSKSTQWVGGNVPPLPSQSPRSAISPSSPRSTSPPTACNVPTDPKTGPQTPKSLCSTGPQHTSTPTPTVSVTTPPTKETSPGIQAHPTVTVSDGQTVSAFVGWVIVGVGSGGAVAVGGEVLPVVGGVTGVIVENDSGRDELSSTSTSSSSSSSRASPTPYNIYPRPGSTSLEQSVFKRHLELVSRPGSVRSITGFRDRLLLWVASLTPAQASELKHDPVVRGLHVDELLPVDLESPSASDDAPPQNCPPDNCSHRKRDGSILMQQQASPDLQIISQARGESLENLPGYAYNSRGGGGVTVYVIETGTTPDHPEVRNMLGSLRWLHVPGEPQIEGDDIGHGTCVMSKIASPTFGVAKSANVVVVRLEPVDNQVQMSRVLAAWGAIVKDIDSKANPAIIFKDTKMAYVEVIKELFNLDVVVVVSSGNRRAQNPGSELATYPALFANEFGLPIVIVGGVDNDGTRGRYSQGLPAELTVSAVGKASCASRGGGATTLEGNSIATPAVAGLAAYFMSLDQYRERLQVPGSFARNVRDLIQSLAYPRLPGQPAVIWNGIDSQQIYCPLRRDAGSSECPKRNTTSGPIIIPPVPGQSSTVTTSSSSDGPTPSAGLTITLPASFYSRSSSSITMAFLTTTVDSGEIFPTVSATVTIVEH